MNFRIALLALALAAAPGAQQAGYSPVQDGEPHGDPPFLLEDGWEPLLNGTDLKAAARDPRV